jgi:hypothetical protein
MKCHELISNESKWTQKIGARSVNNIPICILNHDAVKWCIAGALCVCYPDTAEQIYKMDLLCASLGLEPRFVNLHEWNDSVTYDEVITLLRKLDV